ncbi:MAG: alcohol dehydrogenase, class [Firmicutes bacterium]|nr:alcohol dehydrogenase, class [Bacillota bacterium]
MKKNHSSFLDLRKFVAPEFIFGVGARKLAGRYALNFGARKVLLVSDKFLHSKTSWVDEVEQSFKDAGIPYVLFMEVSPNPRSAEVMHGATVFANEHCDGIVALGGGSVMDCAKGIGIVYANGGNILDFEGVDKIPRAMPPLMCIPTTSGTASEVSQFVIILDEFRACKIAIVSKAVVPDVGLLDPEVTISMDPYLTACSGMDALTHAIEAYVSNASSPITDLHALEAIRLIWEALPEVMVQPSDLGWRAQVLMGSLQAGLAFSNAILGATHAMAHSLGGFLDLPHGECNAILLGPVMQYNYSACLEKSQKIGEIFGLSLEGLPETVAAQQLCQTIENFRRKLGIHNTLKGLGVQRSKFSQLIEYALHDACMATNPQVMTVEDVESIYEQAL